MIFWRKKKGIFPPGRHFSVGTGMWKLSNIEQSNLILQQRVSRFGKKMLSFSKNMKKFDSSWNIAFKNMVFCMLQLFTQNIEHEVTPSRLALAVVKRLRAAPFEGAAIVKPPALPGDIYWSSLKFYPSFMKLSQNKLK